MVGKCIRRIVKNRIKATSKENHQNTEKIHRNIVTDPERPVSRQHNVKVHWSVIFIL